MKGMNRDLAAKIRAHLDEMAALLDREEATEATEVPANPPEPQLPIAKAIPNRPNNQADPE